MPSERPQPVTQILPGRTLAGQEPSLGEGTGAVPPAHLQPVQRVDGRGGQADLHQLRGGADRQPAAGPGLDPHLAGASGCRAGSWVTDAAALASAGLLAGQHRRQHRRGGTKSSFRTGDYHWPPSTTRPTRWTISATGSWKTFPVSMGRTGRHMRLQERHLTCWRSSRDRDGFPPPRCPVDSAEGYKLAVGRGPDRQQRVPSCTARRGRWAIRASATSAMAA